MKNRVVLCGLVASLSLSVGIWAQGTPAQTPAPNTQAASPAAQTPAAPAPVSPIAGPVKVGIINIQRAIVESTEGKKAADDLTKRFTPKRTELDRKQKEVQDLQKKLEDGKNTLSDDMRANLIRDIERKTKDFNRDNDDATTDFQQAEQQLINTIGTKVMKVVDEYARKNTYDVILDVSSQQSPILWATNRIDITDEIIGAYNMVFGAGGEAPAKPAGTAAKPAGTPASQAKPPATAPATKPPTPIKP